MESAALSKADFLCREGQPEREVCVQNGVEGDAGCSGNAAQLWGVDQGIEGAGSGWSRWGNDVSFASSAAGRGSAIWSSQACFPGLVYGRRDRWWRLSPLFDEGAQNFKQINLSILPLSGVVDRRMGSCSPR